MSGDLEDRALAVLRPFVQREESCVLHVYDDGFGNATIGWGSTYYSNGIRVSFGDPAISQEYADALLEKSLEQTIRSVTGVVTMPVGACQLAAMCDLAYNIGLPQFMTSSVLRDFNAGNVEQAHVDFSLWNKARNKETGQLVTAAVLVRRRAREMVLFETPDDQALVAVATPRPPPRSLPTVPIVDNCRQILTKISQWLPLTENERTTMMNLARSGEG